MGAIPDGLTGYVFVAFSRKGSIRWELHEYRGEGCCGPWDRAALEP